LPFNGGGSIISLVGKQQTKNNMKTKFEDPEFKVLDDTGKINYFVDSFGSDGFQDTAGLKKLILDTFKITKSEMKDYTVEEHIQITVNYFAMGLYDLKMKIHAKSWGQSTARTFAAHQNN
jgi:hypothetical protein